MAELFEVFVFDKLAGKVTYWTVHSNKKAVSAIPAGLKM
jgi:hypothetical protein